MKLLYKKPWRDLRRMGKRGVVLLLVLSLCIGFAVSMAFMFTDIMPIFRKYYKDANAADYTYDTYGYNSSILAEIQKIEGVKEVEPRLTFQVPLKLENHDDTYQLLLIGVNVTDEFDDQTNLPIYSYKMLQGAGSNLAPEDAKGTIIISKDFYEANGLAVGTDLNVTGLGGTKLHLKGAMWSIEFIMVNTLPDVMFPVKGTMGVAFIDHEALKSIVSEKNPGLFYPYQSYDYNQILVTFETGADPEAVNDEIESLLANENVERVSSTNFEDSYGWKWMKSDLEGSVKFMGVILVLALIMAFTTSLAIFINFAKIQRSQVGTLGSLGFSKKEISRSFLVLIGEITLVTTALSSLVAYGLMWEMMMEMGTPLLGTQLSYPFQFKFVAVSFVICLSLALLAMMPAIGRMLKRDMVDLLYNTDRGTPTWRARRVKEKTSLRRPSWKLLVRNLVRHPKLSALNLVGVTFSLLIVGGSLVMMSSMMYTTGNKITENELWDASLQFSGPIASDDPSLTAIRDLAQVQKVETALKWQVLMENPKPGADVDNLSSFLTGFGSNFTLHAFNLVEGRTFKDDFEIVVGFHVHKKLDLDVGDNITIHLPTGDVKNFTIVGVTKELSITSYVSLAGLQDLLGIPDQVNTAFVTFDDDVTDRQAVVRELYKQSSEITIIQEMGEVQESIQVYGNMLVPFISLLVGFAAIVEFFILYNAALMTISDHENEFGVLRSLGFPKRKVYLEILSENLMPVLIALGISILMIPVIGNWFLSLFEDQFAVFPWYPWWDYAVTIVVPVLIVLWAARSGLKVVYKRDLYEQVQSQFVA
ncbi:MAG: ABC transporter permease [Promethearchaeota archaeon]